MPQDPNLYGQRPSKRQKKNTALSSSLDFQAHLTSLMSTEKSARPAAAAGRPRPSKEPKESLFHRTKAEKSEPKAGASDRGKLSLKEVHGTEDEAQQRARAKRRMEEKARLYAAMKRGDYVPKENEAAPLVDFDRKWAEDGEQGRGADSSDGSDDDDDEDADAAREMVEFEDEFGRARMVTRAEKDRLERRAQRGLLGAEELERMSARPAAPANIIHGDTIQSMAFVPDDAGGMEELAARRDRSATPPPQQHYDADREVRTKGQGFYKFSRDEADRAREMEGLGEERKRTEEARGAADERKDKRRREMEERRKGLAERRAKKEADSFLDGL